MRGFLRDRRQEVVFHRLRVGHAGVKQYLHRFNMEENDICTHCQATETIQHYLLECPGYQLSRHIMKQKLTAIGINIVTLKIILGGEESYSDRYKLILRIVMEYIKATDRLSTL
jgi:hypothetical protein